MDQETLKFIVAGSVIAFVIWIGGFALFSSHRHGVSAIAVGPRDADAVQWMLLSIAVIIDSYLIVRAVFSPVDQLVLAQPSPSPWIAIILLFAGGMLTIATQLNMGGSWRIGVPAKENDIDALVTDGLHGISRNPIYLGIMAMMAGIVVAAPGPLTVAGFFATLVGLHSIIKKEETYLRAQFGDAYDDYAARVRRWI